MSGALPGYTNDQVLPHAYQVADPFHVVRSANRCVDRGAPEGTNTKRWDTPDAKAILSTGYGAC